MPIAVVVDLDYVRAQRAARCAAPASATSISNLSAIADWRLAERERGEPVDGLAVTFARTAADVDRCTATDGIDDDDFLDRARRGARAVRPRDGDGRLAAGPCSGGDHEILHAIDHLFPGTAHHGELAGVGEPVHVVPARRRRRWRAAIDACLTRHGLPRTPADLGLDRGAVRRRRSLHAPATRPDRYTILEHLDLDEEEVQRARPRVRRRLRSLSCARPRSRASIFERNSGEHWAGRLYMRRVLAVPDAAAAAARG